MKINPCLTALASFGSRPKSTWARVPCSNTRYCRCRRPLARRCTGADGLQKNAAAGVYPGCGVSACARSDGQRISEAGLGGLKLLQTCGKDRQLGSHRLPYEFGINVKIRMDKTIAHSRNRIPRDVRADISSLVGDLTRRLADDLNASDQRKQQHPVCIEFNALATGNELCRVAGGFHHVLETYAVFRRHIAIEPCARYLRGSAGSGRLPCVNRPFDRHRVSIIPLPLPTEQSGLVPSPIRIQPADRHRCLVALCLSTSSQIKKGALYGALGRNPRANAQRHPSQCEWASWASKSATGTTAVCRHFRVRSSTSGTKQNKRGKNEFFLERQAHAVTQPS